ncbi:recombinase family protein, partial [Vibrio cholerae]|uniref:recombinase family protein n=1 Tax=Vibrio cholerae TaxID=666 RepID=UPI002A240B11
MTRTDSSYERVPSGGKVMFHVIGAIAEFERSLISDRTRAGMAAARARGQHLGRERKMTDEDVGWARRMIEL